MYEPKYEDHVGIESGSGPMLFAWIAHDLRDAIRANTEADGGTRPRSGMVHTDHASYFWVENDGKIYQVRVTKEDD